MKLKIENLENFKFFANAYYQKYSNRCWNRTIVSCGETPDWYDFRVAHGGFEWTVKLGKNKDFMPGWPTIVLWRKNSISNVKRLMEGNVSHDILSDKLRWAERISELIDIAVQHNYKLIHS